MVDLVEKYLGRRKISLPVIKDGISVRSRLRSEDLRLIRMAFVRYAEVASYRDVVRCSDLLWRMLRKVK